MYDCACAHRWFARAYVGELRLLLLPVDVSDGTALSQPAACLLVSVLDFWGNRYDRVLTLGQWGTPLANNYRSDTVPGGAVPTPAACGAHAIFQS